MTLMWKEIHEQPEVLRTCLEKNKSTIAEIVRLLDAKGIGSVYIAARGTSDHAGIYAKYIIELVKGVPVAMAAPSILTMYQKSLNLKNTLVIGISQSGKAADVLEVVKEGNRQGALTVSVTNFPDSPMAQEANFHLCCEAGLEKSVAATKTFTSQLMLLANLAAEWAKDEKMKEDLNKVPQLVEETLKLGDEIAEKVQRYRFMNECFMLARGVNYAIAMEAALKTQETGYIRAKAYAVSDFHHGPFAMIEKDMPVFVYAPEGPSLHDMLEILNKLKERDAEIVVISNNQQVLDMGMTSFRIPDTDNDVISPFLNVVVAQMFACQLSLARGLNPDSPRGLNKVTITR